MNTCGKLAFVFFSFFLSISCNGQQSVSQKQIDDNFRAMNESFEYGCRMVMSFKQNFDKNFKEKMLLEKAKYQFSYEQYQKLNMFSSDVVEVLDEAKETIVAELKKGGNYTSVEIPTKVLTSIGKGKIAEKVKSFDDFALQCNAIHKADKDYIMANLNQATIEDAIFKDVSAIGALAMLSRVKSDILNTVYKTGKYLMAGCDDVADVRVNTFTAVVVPKTSYLKVGQVYKADVQLAAFDSTWNYNVYLAGKKQTGKNIKLPCSSVGKKSVDGYVEVVPRRGPAQKYPFVVEYMVTK